MNKADIVNKVSDDHGISKAQASGIVDGIFDGIVSTVAGGTEVSIAGFGIFESKARPARMGRNPRTGESIQIKASVSPKFRAAKGFKDAVNK